MNAADICRNHDWNVGDVLIESLCRAHEIRFIGDEIVVMRRTGTLRATGTWAPLHNAPELPVALEEPGSTPSVLVRQSSTPLKTYGELGPCFIEEQSSDRELMYHLGDGQRLRLSDGTTDWVMLIDTARPLTTPEVCFRLLGSLNSLPHAATLEGNSR